MNLPSYSRADVVRWFGKREVAKGEPYLTSVDKLSVQANRITAEVQGTAKRPYRVSVNLFAYQGAVADVHAQCSCPVAWRCKHGAAVLLAALRAKDNPKAVNAEVLAWLEAFRQAAVPKAAGSAKTPKKRQVLLYALRMPESGYGPWHVDLLKANTSAEGVVSPIEDWNNVERALLKPPRFVAEEDLDILRMLWMQRSHDSYYGEYPLAGPHSDELMRRMLACGRLFVADDDHERLIPLATGDERPGCLTWRHDPVGRLVPAVETTPAAEAVVPVGRLWYLDVAAGVVGAVQLPYPGEQASRLLSIPPLEPPDLPVVVAALADLAPALPAPASARLREVDGAPLPVLSLGTVSTWSMPRYRGYTYMDRLFDFARPSFRYGELEVDVDDKAEFVTTPEGEMVRLRRRANEEAKWLKALRKHGLTKVPNRTLYSQEKAAEPPLYGLENEQAWPQFMLDEAPRLRAAGWELRVPADFRHNILPVEAWEAELAEDENGWFTLDMGIVVEDRRLPLAPLLYNLFRHDPRWLDAAQLERLADDEQVRLVTPEGARLVVSAARLKPLARTLIDLFDAPTEGPLRLSLLDAPRLAELAAMERWQFKGAQDVRRLAQRLQASHGIKRVAPPKGFGLQLRPYQREGLAWLQFLREQGLAGILADDMGLGKTAQTLAHLLAEKLAGRLDRPALVVLPTSLLFNWKREAERCAPALRLLSLHGPEHKEQFPQIRQHDVVLTTYPLLWRDAEQLAAVEYHVVILDEAQTVKNVASKAAQVVRQIKTRHRLCLTGTPLENHLGELWAQFDFLLPGFLGDNKSFTRAFRSPIEKHGDALRRDLLARRVKPFILRRRKEAVAKELPSKSIIVRSMELEGAQRDLYETVRSAMDRKVREAIAAQGFARSQIVILDALLKLRQVCCDPRLLKTAAAKRVKKRAKLDLLMDMVPELVDEGRRILLFSQFTSMLDLIAAELTDAAIPFVTLTGRTRNRERVIKRFQEGDAPLFLISLKAGGVGLNLTAADTVIHFDPWWNPAVENQATDRAHRIGQTKPVFVYKLIVAGSIEEKILALQEKKAGLAAGILSDDAAALAKFSESDISALLAPLPTADGKKP